MSRYNESRDPEEDGFHSESQGFSLGVSLGTQILVRISVKLLL